MSATGNPSPISSYYHPTPPSDPEDAWHYLDYPITAGGSSAPSSVGFLPSPSSGSLNGYAIVGSVPGAAASPVFLDLDQPGYAVSSGSGAVPSGSRSNSTAGATVGSTFTEHDPTSEFAGGQVPVPISGIDDVHGGGFGNEAGNTPLGSFLTPQDLLLTEAQLDELAPFFNEFSGSLPHAGMENFPAAFHFTDAPWDPSAIPVDQQHVLEQILPPLRDLSPQAVASVSSSASASASPSPSPRPEPRTKHPGPIRKVKAGKVEKNKRSTTATSSAAAAAAAASAADQSSKFVIMTPTTISARSGRANPFDSPDESFLRTSHKGRKGPLASATKQSALQVRRLGACFCCHARKVKCDKERPCRNCTRIAAHVPQVVCWQFPDFLPVLFPGFIRTHFAREEISRFLDENVEGFGAGGGGGGGAEGCEVELFSGPRFRAVLRVRAKFFTAKTEEVGEHWHLHANGSGVDLRPRDAVPIGFDPGEGGQREEIKKRAKEYIQALLGEEAFAEQLTDVFQHTHLPRRVLEIVRSYWEKSKSLVVRRALSVYTLHYVLTRHLCITRRNMLTLAAMNPLLYGQQNNPWPTPRVLNRQIKAVMDDLMQRETQLIFESFSRLLKPKSRKEWAPCLAAFLVLCLLMEAVETASDNFVVSRNEIAMRKREAPPDMKRRDALRVNLEIERLPFKQFAYQFHQIYQTHSRDGSGKAFNPLMEEFVEGEDLDGPAVELVRELRGLLDGESLNELDSLTRDPILPNEEDHPYPRDISYDYTGRLVSKFLLSFTDEKYIFDPDG